MTPSQPRNKITNDSPRSDYKDDGTNVLLDANENAYGPGLALNNGKPASTTVNVNATEPSIEIDMLGLHRYPDPYHNPAITAHPPPTDTRPVTSTS